MSKAFTKESDQDEGEDFVLPDLPSGGKNYITPEGFARLQTELLDLIDKERPKVTEVVHWAAKNGDRSENGDYIYGKQRLRQIDKRIHFLTKRLEIAEIVDPSVHHGSEQIFFGATVVYEEISATGPSQERKVCIIGIDEADTQNGQVSWIAPIARVLLKNRVGDVLRLPTPTGEVQIEVLQVDYPEKP